MSTDADRRIKVLHFISNSAPTEHFRLIAKHTDHAQFEMHVASLDAPDGLQADLAEIGIPTFALGAERRSEYPLATLRLARWLRRHSVDVLHTHLFEASLVGLMAAKLAHTRLAIFTGHHSHEVPLHNRRALLAIDRFAARRLADLIIAPSAEMRDTFVDLYGCPAASVVVIEHGIDLARFDPDRVDRAAIRDELALDGKLVIGAISKYFWVKNLDALISAFAAFVAQRPDAHLVILGRGNAVSLEPKVRRLGLQDQVTLLAERGDVPSVLAGFDMFIHPALAESFGLAIIEAMAMRLPTASTPVGIARDVITDGVSGIEIHGTDERALLEAMNRLVARRDNWLALGNEARRRALAFTPERWVRAHEQLYAARLGREPSREAHAS